MTRWGLVVWFVLAGTTAAAAPPYDGVRIEFRRGSTQDIAVGTTFGLILSHDAGATWHWFCPQAAHYGGTYVPRLAYSSTGSLFAPSFDGLVVQRDGCSFATGPLGMTFASALALGPEGALHVTAADPNDAKIYTSTDDGVTFPTTANPGIANDWWQSIIVAPSDGQRVYLSGYRLVLRCDAASGNAGTTCTTNATCTNGGVCEMQKDQLLFRSDNGAASFSPLATTSFATTQYSTIDMLGIDPAAPDRVYAAVSFATMSGGSDLYRSDDAGVTWTKILSTSSGPISFVARANGQIVAATPASVAQVSTDHGATWTPIGCDLHISCLAETAAGEVWACTHNYAYAQIPSDGFGLMKTSDLVAWTGVLSFADIAGPADCASGTIEHDTCAPLWSDVSMNLQLSGVTPNHCSMPDGPPPPPVQPDGTQPPPAGGGGCCSTNRGDPGSLAPGLIVAGAIVRRRRRAR